MIITDKKRHSPLAALNLSILQPAEITMSRQFYYLNIFYNALQRAQVQTEI